MKKLNKSDFNFLFNEFNYQKRLGNITQEQVDSMMNSYEEKTQLSFIGILVTIGAVLIGAGILSFVASNWVYLGKLSKVIIIIIAFGGSLFASFKIEESYEKTSKALLYLSSLIFGAGIFLIGQIFNYGGHFTNAFLLWSVGVTGIAFALKEKYLFLFSHILFLVYINGSFNKNIMIYSILIIVLFYFGNKLFNYSRIITFVNNIVCLNFILYLLHYTEVKGIYITLIFIVIGLGMFYIKHRANYEIFKVQGNFIIGISGLFLTSKSLWEGIYFITNGNPYAISCAVLLLIYLLFLIKKGNIISLLFICALIVRYYFDTLYDFMPKSIFFLVGGFILLGFGYYFEKIRKRQGGIINEDAK